MTVTEKSEIAKAVKAYATGIEWDWLTIPLILEPLTKEGYLIGTSDGGLEVVAEPPSVLVLPVAEVFAWSDERGVATVRLSDGTIRNVKICDLDVVKDWVCPIEDRPDNDEMEAVS